MSGCGMDRERNYELVLIVVIAVLMVFFVFWYGYALADKEVELAVSYAPLPVPPPPARDPTEKIIDILLSQGVAGVGLIVLAWWIKTSTAQARTDRLRIEERVFDLVERTNKNLAEQHSELANISRELERIRG
jgi:hypothetical protein